MQRVHFQVSVVKTNTYFVNSDIVVQNKANVVQRGQYSYGQRYGSSQRSKFCGLARHSQVSPQQIELHHKARALL